MDDWKTRLTQARKARGLNKTEFARLTEVSNPTITDWEKPVELGGIKDVSAPKLMRICEVLEIDLWWLMTGKERAFGGGLAENELHLLSVYRMADEDGRALFEMAAAQVRALIDARRASVGQR